MTGFKNTILAAMTALALAGCSTSDKNSAVVGGATGAIVGGVATGSVKGAAVGSAIGAGAGVLVNRILNHPGYCRYRKPNGRLYIARC